MLTGAQFGRYNREWTDLCAVRGWDVHDEAARLAFHRRHRLPASRKAWDVRGHFDTFLAACKEEKGIRTGGTKRVDEDGQRRRLVWRIKDDAKKAGLAPGYIKECARDLHVLGNWEDLDLDSLTHLMKTIHTRAGQKLGHDPRNVRHTAPRCQYTLDGGARTFSPHVSQPKAETAPARKAVGRNASGLMSGNGMAPGSSDPTGNPPAEKPAGAPCYCTHAVTAPPVGLPADITLTEFAYAADPDNEPF